MSKRRKILLSDVGKISAYKGRVLADSGVFESNPCGKVLDADFVMYPSGVKASKLYSQTGIRGELILNITDRDFSGANNWAQFGIATINTTGGKMVVTVASADGGAFLHGSNVNDYVIGKIGSIRLTLSNVVGTVYVQIDGGLKPATALGNGTHYMEFDIGDTADSLGEIRVLSTTGGSFDIDDVSQKQIGTDDFTVTRASVATRINSAGLIEEVAANVPRLDYTDSTCPTLLLEPASTNLILRSESFDNAYWTLTNTTLLSGQSAPDGSNNAFKLIESNDVGDVSHLIKKNGITGLNSGEDGVAEICVKNNGRKYCVLQSFSPTKESYFNTETGVWDNIAAQHTVTVKSLINGWYRISIAYTSTSTDNARFTAIMSDNSITKTYTGDGVSGLFIFAGQLEFNASYPTSYIKSDLGITTTRNADVVTGAGDVNSFNSVEGVLYLETASLFNDLTNRSISLSDGSSSNKIALKYDNSSNQIELSVVVSPSGVVASIAKILSDETNFSKIALRWKVNDFALWVDGIEVGTDTVGISFGANILNVIDFHNANGIGNFYGKVKTLKVFKTFLNDTQMASLTTTGKI